MSGKDIIIDFVNYLFLILIGVFMLFYVVFGNRLDFFAEILNLLMALSFFAFVFLIILKIKRRQIKKYAKEDMVNEIVVYISPTDILIDRFIILASLSAVIAIAYIGGDINIADFFQAFIPTITLLFWRQYLFKSGLGINKSISLTRLDKAKDEIIIFFLPIVLLIIPALGRTTDSVDAYQAAALLLILFFGHYRIFKEK